MINLHRAVNTLESLQVGLTNAINQVTKAIAVADTVDAKELSGALDIVKRNLAGLDPYSVPLASLKALAEQYKGTVEEVDHQVRAAKIVAAMTNVSMDKATRELAEKNVAEALASLDS
jgi:NACalpha-BTF3-like transcription factor